MSSTVPLTREKESVILDAAQKRFAQYGLTKVTMDEIAADVGMGKASIYYYFPTKEDLFRSVIRREQQQFTASIQTVLQSDSSATDKLRHYVTRSHQCFSELFNLKRLSLNIMHAPKPIFQELFSTFADEELHLLAEILKSGKSNSEFAISHPRKTAELLLRLLQGLRIRYVKQSLLADGYTKDAMDLEQDTHQFMDIFLRGIARTH